MCFSSVSYYDREPRSARPVNVNACSSSTIALDVDIVTVIVGPSVKKFRIHKVALYAMPTISDELKNRQAEDNYCLDFELPECHTPEIFKMVVKCIYDNALLEPATEENFWTRTVPLYKLARYLEIWDLHNLLLDECLDYRSSIGLLRSLYDSDLRGTQLYKLHLAGLVANLMTKAPDEIKWDEVKGELSGEPLYDVTSSMRDYDKEPWVKNTWEDRCIFHVHLDGLGC